MLKTSLEGFEALQAVVGKIVDTLTPDFVLEEAQALLLNRIRTRFLEYRGPVARWVPSAAGLRRLSGKYTYRNGKKYTGTGTLFETGTLFHSIQAFREDPYTVSIGTDVPYAIYLQNGTLKMPPRVFLGVNDEDALLVSKLVIKRLKEVL